MEPSKHASPNAAEQALLESRAQADRQRRLYEGILNNTPDLAYVFDLDHRFIYANEGLLRMWGKSWDEAIGKTCLELGYEPWHAAMHDREIEQVVRTRQPVRGEVPFSGTFGRRVYDYIFVPVFGPAGNVEAIAGTTRDVTDYRNLVIERDRASHALAQSEAALRESNQRKDEFIAMLSHELRNPLAPLRNALELLRLSGSSGPAAAVHDMMARQVSHLVRLVDDLLEMSRIDRGALELRKERVELAAIVRNALETSQPLMQSAGHLLDVSLPEEAVWLEGDSVRLAQILANLLNNAAKYTGPGGRIELRAGVEGGIVSICVRDNGAGIAPEILSQLFGMFTRVGPPSSRAQGGLGIGLALARRLATMHGGDIEARSEGLGKGSEFVVRLPVSNDPAPASSERAPAAAAALPQQRILVVDDNRDAADSLGMLLKFLGADVRIARDGSEALEQFEAYDPRVVLLDIGMPGMDGYEVARRIRTGFPGHDATLVAVTGWGQEKDRRLAQEAGFDQHIIKPPEIGALRALLAALGNQAPSRASRTSSSSTS